MKKDPKSFESLFAAVFRAFLCAAARTDSEARQHTLGLAMRGRLLPKALTTL